MVKIISDFMEFTFPNQSFTVNSVFLAKIMADKIYLKNSDVQISIARGKLQSVKEAYNKYFKIVVQKNPEADIISAV